MKNKKIYLFGNPLLPFDSLPFRFAPRLRESFPEIEFIEFDPNENLKPIDKELVIIDTVEGIDEVKILTDIEKIATQPMYSLHDFDLGFNLKLLHKIGELDKVTIFCLPMEGDEKIILDGLIKHLKQNNL